MVEKGTDLNLYIYFTSQMHSQIEIENVVERSRQSEAHQIKES